MSGGKDGEGSTREEKGVENEGGAGADGGASVDHTAAPEGRERDKPKALGLHTEKVMREHVALQRRGRRVGVRRHGRLSFKNDLRLKCESASWAPTIDAEDRGGKQQYSQGKRPAARSRRLFQKKVDGGRVVCIPRPRF